MLTNHLSWPACKNAAEPGVVMKMELFEPFYWNIFHWDLAGAEKASPFLSISAAVHEMKFAE